MKLYKSTYSEIRYDEPKDLIRQVFFLPTLSMKDEEFRQEMTEYLKQFNDFKPKYELLDFWSLKFKILPQTQIWLSENIFARKEQSTEKIAIVLPQDFYAKAFIKEAITEDIRTYELSASFSQKAEAAKWLLSKKYKSATH